MILYRCDLCGEIRDCSQKEIERTEYDICSECWNSLMSKLKNNGRPKAQRESPVLSPAVIVPEKGHEPKQPFPGQPPDIIAGLELAN